MSSNKGSHGDDDLKELVCYGIFLKIIHYTWGNLISFLDFIGKVVDRINIYF
jgi:hypothetical protein